MVVSDKELLDILKRHMVIKKDGSTFIKEITEDDLLIKYNEYLKQHAKPITDDDGENKNLEYYSSYCFSQVM